MLCRWIRWACIWNYLNLVPYDHQRGLFHLLHLHSTQDVSIRYVSTSYNIYNIVYILKLKILYLTWQDKLWPVNFLTRKNMLECIKIRAFPGHVLPVDIWKKDTFQHWNHYYYFYLQVYSTEVLHYDQFMSQCKL